MRDVDPTATYELPSPTDSVRHQGGEGWQHWSGKAGLVAWLSDLDGVHGEIEAEKKVEDLVADIRCNLSDSGRGLPEKFAVEIQTRRCNSSIPMRISRYHRYGYTVFYLYTTNAEAARNELENCLGGSMPEHPSVGEIDPEQGWFRLGQPITPESVDLKVWDGGLKEFYVPTHDRSAPAYDHGDFEVNAERTALVRINGKIYGMKEIGDDGQRTLPSHPGVNSEQLLDGLMNGDVSRLSPVRGTP